MSKSIFDRCEFVEPPLDPPRDMSMEYYCVGCGWVSVENGGKPEMDDVGEEFCVYCLKLERPRKCLDCGARRPVDQLFCRNCGAAASTVEEP